MLSLTELSDLLSKKSADFEIIRHDTPILKTEDAAIYFDISKAVPVFIVQTEKGLYALIVSSVHKRINLKELGQKLNFNKLKFADKKVILETTGYETGSLPLIGHNLPTFFDKDLLKFDFIYGGTGDKLHTLKVPPDSVVDLNRNTIIIEI
jgi:prolyl-tRNA editing enzyme YbaK/EbsC (Cys-tRNA(Pro) deacylase)